MKLWKTILIQTGIFTSVFALGVGAGFLACYKKKVEPVVETPVVVAKEEPTATERFLDNLVSAKAISGDINLSIAPSREKNDQPMPTRAFDEFNVENIDVEIKNLQISLESIQDIKVSGDINLKIENLDLDLSVGYFDNTIFLDCLNTHLFMKTEDISDVMDMLPTFGVNFELPEEFTNLDYNALIGSLANMEEYREGEEHYFLFNFSDDIQVKFLSNENYEMVGVELPKTNILGMEISATSTLSCEKEVKEMNAPDVNKYMEFKPAFSLIDNVVELVEEKKAHIDLSLDIDELSEGQYQDFFSIVGDLDFDVDTQQVSTNILVDEHERQHNIKAAYSDETVFVSFRDLNVSIKQQSIQYLVEYISTKVSTDKIDEIMDQVSRLTDDINLETIFGCVNDLPEIINDFELTNNSLSLTFNSKYFDLPISSFSLEVTFDENNINTVDIKGVEFENYRINAHLALSDYKEINIDKAKYVAIDPALSLIDSVEELIDQDQFGVRFYFDIDDGDDRTIDINMSGKFLFNLEKVEKEEGIGRNFVNGAGELKIVDSDLYPHKIVADAQGEGKVLLKYSGESENTTNAKFDNETVDSIVELATKLYNDKDDHFMELFGNLLDNAKAMPIKQIIDGDYGLLLSTNIIKNLDVTEDTITLEVNGALIGEDALNFNVIIHYDEDHIYGIDIFDFAFGGKTLYLTVELFDYSEAEHNKYRLVDDDSYLDLSSLSLFLELGLNTSKYNYYHFSGKISITLLDFIGKDMNADLKIINDKGHVKVLGVLTNIPVIIYVSDNYYIGLDRSAYFMYDNETELFHVCRHDYKERWLLDDIDDHVSIKCTSEYFLDNILTIMCRDMLGLSDSIMNKISSAGAGEGQIKYENIVEEYGYDSSQKMFTFGINVGEIARNKDLGSLTLKVYANNKNELNSVDIKMHMDPGVPIDLNLNMALQSDIDVNVSGHELTFLEEYVVAHQNDELNKTYKY